MEHFNLQPSDQLSILTYEVGALRRHLIKQRLRLPSPGYHYIFPEDVRQDISTLLADLPQHCVILRAALRDFQDQTDPAHFREASVFLEELQADPALLFRMPVIEISRCLRADAELIASIGVDPNLLNGKDSTPC